MGVAMKLFSHKKRPVHLGPYPLEPATAVRTDCNLRSVATPDRVPTNRLRPRRRTPISSTSTSTTSNAMARSASRGRSPTTRKSAPTTSRPACTSSTPTWWVARRFPTTPGSAIRSAIATPSSLIATLESSATASRATTGSMAPVSSTLTCLAELAVITAGYLRRIGFDAVAHTPTATDLDLERAALQCGLIESAGGKLRAPFLDTGFALSVVSTDMELALDSPLAPRNLVDSLRTTHSPQWFLGRGTRPGSDASTAIIVRSTWAVTRWRRSSGSTKPPP